jgi:3-oxoacyl-[acyl-carrier protein] reductase
MSALADVLALDGKVAIVTGGARGIGLATARRLTQAGASTLIADLDAAAAKAAAAELGANAHGEVGDITDPAVPGRLVERAVEQFGRLDIVVNNAGYNWDNPLVEMTDEQFTAMLDIHVVAPFRLLRAAGPHLISGAKADLARGVRANRKVVNMSSVSGTMGEPWQQNYNAGKAAILGVTKGLAREWGEYHINVNAVAPGIVDTRLTQTDTAGEHITTGGQTIPLGLSDERRTDLTDIVPFGRPGTPREIGDVVFFLCTPAADYIHGQVISVTGGLVMGMSS